MMDMTKSSTSVNGESLYPIQPSGAENTTNIFTIVVKVDYMVTGIGYYLKSNNIVY